MKLSNKTRRHFSAIQSFVSESEDKVQRAYNVSHKLFMESEYRTSDYASVEIVNRQLSSIIALLSNLDDMLFLFDSMEDSENA